MVMERDEMHHPLIILFSSSETRRSWSYGISLWVKLTFACSSYSFSSPKQMVTQLLIVCGKHQRKCCLQRFYSNHQHTSISLLVRLMNLWISNRQPFMKDYSLNAHYFLWKRIKGYKKARKTRIITRMWLVLNPSLLSRLFSSSSSSDHHFILSSSPISSPIVLSIHLLILKNSHWANVIFNDHINSCLFMREKRFISWEKNV